MIRTADISPCGLYRWKLSRDWPTASARPGRACFVMLNPSTADGSKDDPTLRMCIHFAQAWGFGGLDVVNLFPFRSSSPIECFSWAKNNTEGNVVTHNLNTVAHAVIGASIVVAAWGAAPWAKEAGDFVGRFVNATGRDLFCLGTTQDGSPKHPLARGVHRIPRDQKPILWRPTEENDQ